MSIIGSSLTNTHHGVIDGFEVVDVEFGDISVFRRRLCPTIPTLCVFVMRAGYPRPSEVKRVEQREEGVYRLFIRREPCPVLFLGGARCPMCGEEHEH